MSMKKIRVVSLEKRYARVLHFDRMLSFGEPLDGYQTSSPFGVDATNNWFIN
jgi:hypothetical protein